MENEKGGCTIVDPSSGLARCVDPPMCFRPAQWVCAEVGTVSCQCVVVPRLDAGRLCTASIVYGVNTPANPSLVPMEAHCSAAGVEIALAVMLARCVQGLASCGAP